MLKIYLAGPMTGLTAKEVIKHIKNRKKQLEGYTVYHPMAGKGFLSTEGILKASGYKSPLISNHHIIERDRWMVSQVDVVFADLSNTNKVSIGTCMELAWAYDMKKYTVVVMEKGNIHEHCFILEAADVIFEDINLAMQYLNKLETMEI